MGRTRGIPSSKNELTTWDSSLQLKEFVDGNTNGALELSTMVLHGNVSTFLAEKKMPSIVEYALL